MGPGSGVEGSGKCYRQTDALGHPNNYSFRSRTLRHNGIRGLMNHVEAGYAFRSARCALRLDIALYFFYSSISDRDSLTPDYHSFPLRFAGAGIDSSPKPTLK